MGVSRYTTLGEQASLNFHVACVSRGLLLARPLWDCGYDVIVHNPTTHAMWRVQVKKAQPLQGGKYWVGSTHRQRGKRYAVGVVQRFVFERPDGTGFWILDGSRLDGAAGRGLTDKDWEKWDLFDVQEPRQ